MDVNEDCECSQKIEISAVRMQSVPYICFYIKNCLNCVIVYILRLYAFILLPNYQFYISYHKFSIDFLSLKHIISVHFKICPVYTVNQFSLNMKHKLYEKFSVLLITSKLQKYIVIYVLN